MSVEDHKLRILAICGSLRRESVHRALIMATRKVAPASIEIVPYFGLADIPHYNFDQQAEAFPPTVLSLADDIHKADGVLIVSPEYNWSVPGVLKNAIDWVSRLKDNPFRHKPVAMQSASNGLLGGARSQYHLRQILNSMDAVTLNKPEVFVGHVKERIDVEKAEFLDHQTKEFVEHQLGAFAHLIAAQRLVSAGKVHG